MIVGLQTYTIRKLAQMNLPLALKEIGKLGIVHLELARVPFSEATITAIKDAKMKVVAIQDKYQHLDKHFAERIRFLKALDVDTAVVSVLPLGAILGGKRAVKRFAKRLNELAKRSRSEGIRLAFHHHDFEFKMAGCKTKLAHLLEELDPEVGIVMDTYWASKSKQDLAQLTATLGSRLCGIHLRDHQDIEKSGKRRSRDCAVGSGDIDFTRFLPLLRQNRIYGVIEQNSESPLGDIKKSIVTLKKIGLWAEKGKA